MKPPTSAFVLGAGLGTRLRPLTNSLPKPLVPIFNKPLATFAIDHLIASGIERFVVNTHHRPEAYNSILGGNSDSTHYRGREIRFRHEPVLLDTGGGIRNARDLLGDDPFVLYNGDILADFPLAPLIEAHYRSENIATLALRSNGAEKRIQCDPANSSVTDLRGLIGERSEPAFVFAGISVFSPEIHRHIPTSEPVSIIPVLADLVRAGAPVGGVVLDEGLWFDIGTPGAYIEIHRLLSQRLHSFSYLPADWLAPLSPAANIAPEARILGCTSVGAGAVVPLDASLKDTIIWPNTVVPPGASLSNAILTGDACHFCDPHAE